MSLVWLIVKFQNNFSELFRSNLLQGLVWDVSEAACGDQYYCQLYYNYDYRRFRLQDLKKIYSFTFQML